MNKPDNPFQLTRAADLDDSQINSLWVDFQNKNGFDDKFRPRSQLPMIILGGKGSGKTHLMRYYSFPLQKLRAIGTASLETLRATGYIGVYTRCSGLNASRFSGKGQSAEKWTEIFAFYIELWFAQIILETASDFMRTCNQPWGSETTLIRELCGLFDKAPSPQLCTLNDLASHLKALQRNLDYEINNAALSHTLNIEVVTTRGSLIFGMPKLLSQYEPAFAGLIFTLLIDEYENLYGDAQRYINTLVREKQLPVTFKIGARLYGIRTYSTFSGDEELKEGSESWIRRENA